MGLPDGSEVKNLPVNAGDAGDMGSIPGQKDPLEMATCSSIVAWEIPWTAEANITVHGVAKSQI